MAMRKVSVVLLAVNLAAMLFSFVVEGGEVEDVVQESSGGLPFLQFKNGGVRVNFGGYHAEAGLGSILTGSRAGGGLHASAGTPFGAHAGAGLGGLLNGDNASTGGGLHAEAGLGNGRPEARAGLGGVLDANSNNPIAGGLYAHATPGDATVQNTVGSGVQVQSAQKPTTGHTNIQIISGGGGHRHKNEREIATKSFVVVNQAAPPEPKISPAPVAPLLPIPSAGVYGGLYAGASTGQNIEKDIVGSVQTIPATGIKSTIVETSVPSRSNVAAEANAAAHANVNVAQEQPVYNRWYFRKRFRTGPIRKQVIHTTSFVPNPPNTASASGTAFGAASGSAFGAASGIASGAAPGAASGTASAAATGEIFSRVNADNVASGELAIGGTKTYKPGSLFDDIFNIPISTLTAVNQLLKNNVG